MHVRPLRCLRESIKQHAQVSDDADIQSFIAGPYSSNQRRQKLPVGSSEITRSCPHSQSAPGCTSQVKQLGEQSEREHTGEQSGRLVLDLRLINEYAPAVTVSATTETATRLWSWSVGKQLVSPRRPGGCFPLRSTSEPPVHELRP